MEKNNAILFAYEITGDGRGIPLENEAISQKIKEETLAWVHLDAEHEGAREWLREEVSYLDHIIIDALLAEETRPRILEFEQGAMMILRGVNLNENAAPEDMISIRLWIDGSRIISIRRRKLKAVQDIRERLENGKGPKNSGEFISSLAGRLFERMEPVFSDLDDKLDDLEERIMENPDTKERQNITVLRKQAILFRRYIAPQKDVMAHLRSADFDWLNQMHTRRIQESLDRTIRYVEDLDAIRERAQIVKDELANSLADKMNKNMYVLSIVAAIFLPLGFLTGLLGINVGGMPGADNDFAFWLVCILCVAFVIVIGGLFRFLKWL